MSASGDVAAGGAAGRVIEVGAAGDRQSLEVLYLELRQVAKQHGLKIGYRLSDAGDCTDASLAEPPPP
jgi:hypothetical protein